MVIFNSYVRLVYQRVWSYTPSGITGGSRHESWSCYVISGQHDCRKTDLIIALDESAAELLNWKMLFQYRRPLDFLKEVDVHFKTQFVQCQAPAWMPPKVSSQLRSCASPLTPEPMTFWPPVACLVRSSFGTLSRPKPWAPSTACATFKRQGTGMRCFRPSTPEVWKLGEEWGKETCRWVSDESQGLREGSPRAHFSIFYSWQPLIFGP